MIIEPWKIPPEGDFFEGEEPPEVFDWASDPDLEPVAPVRYNLRAQLVHRELLVDGRVQTCFRVRCSRCGESFEQVVTDEQFERAIEVPDRFQCVDLTADIRESMILALPSYPLCRVECRGLCAGCGANLNREACRCERRDEGGWSALDGWKAR